eukprot:1143305-Pelagomonas_calceolata.AAC.8
MHEEPATSLVFIFTADLRRSVLQTEMQKACKMHVLRSHELKQIQLWSAMHGSQQTQQHTYQMKWAL